MNINIQSLNDLYRFRIHKNIRKMISTYITDCGSKGTASQLARLSFSLSALDRQTEFS